MVATEAGQERIQCTGQCRLMRATQRENIRGQTPSGRCESCPTSMEQNAKRRYSQRLFVHLRLVTPRVLPKSEHSPSCWRPQGPEGLTSSVQFAKSGKRFHKYLEFRHQTLSFSLAPLVAHQLLFPRCLDVEGLDRGRWRIGDLRLRDVDAPASCPAGFFGDGQ